MQKIFFTLFVTFLFSLGVVKAETISKEIAVFRIDKDIFLLSELPDFASDIKVYNCLMGGAQALHFLNVTAVDIEFLQSPGPGLKHLQQNRSIIQKMILLEKLGRYVQSNGERPNSHKSVLNLVKPNLKNCLGRKLSKSKKAIEDLLPDERVERFLLAEVFIQQRFLGEPPPATNKELQMIKKEFPDARSVELQKIYREKEKNRGEEEIKKFLQGVGSYYKHQEFF